MIRNSDLHDTIIIGGGLAGLISAIELSKAGLKVLLIEKKRYPFHKVCGEYISNESLPYLKSLEIDPFKLDASTISKFLLSSPSGKFLTSNLEMGGFGISRFLLDSFIYQKAENVGTEVLLAQEVEKVDFQNNLFTVSLANGTDCKSRFVIGAYGKRAKLDKVFNRTFMEKKSPYLGVKYHIKTDFPSDLIALHNFKDGYCGISKVEGDTFNLCYLSHRENLRAFKTIKEMEENVIFKNPFLKNIFQNSEFLFEKPEVINEVSFEKKSLVEDHVLMVGDTAGMITPLCGNGMSMAIHGAKILSHLIVKANKENWEREKLEQIYSLKWNKTFSTRLLVGRSVQRMFGKEILSEIMVGFFKSSPSLTRFAINQTHGKVF